MTDLIQRLHAQAEKRGVATSITAYGTQGQVFENLISRHPLEIAHEMLAKLGGGGYGLHYAGANTWSARPHKGQWINDEFITVVVELAEAEQGNIYVGCKVENSHD